MGSGLQGSGMMDAGTDELCDAIAARDACDETCAYALQDAELQALVPFWLTMEICTNGIPDVNGQGSFPLSYWAICPDQCPFDPSTFGSGLASGDFPPTSYGSFPLSYWAICPDQCPF